MSSRIISPELEGQVLDAVLRSHFPSFLRKVFSTLSPGQTFESGWAVEAMAYQIERLLSGDERRLIVNLPQMMRKRGSKPSAKAGKATEKAIDFRDRGGSARITRRSA